MHKHASVAGWIRVVAVEMVKHRNRSREWVRSAVFGKCGPNTEWAICAKISNTHL